MSDGPFDLDVLAEAPRSLRVDRDRTLFRLSLLFRDRADALNRLPLYGELMRLNDEEDANRFASLRAEIRSGALRGQALINAISRSAVAAADIDFEETLERVLAIRTPRDAHVGFTGGRSAYMPSRIDHLLEAFELGNVSPDDHLVDIGSGAGKAVFLAHLVFGATAHGVEIREDLVERAEEARRTFGLDAISFEAGDVRDATLHDADVFYLFNPFDIATTTVVLRKIGEVASLRDLRVITLNNTLEAPWLKEVVSNEPITVYRSTRRA